MTLTRLVSGLALVLVFLIIMSGCATTNVSGAAPDYTEQDLSLIDLQHTGVNTLWTPTWNFDDGRRIPVHFVTSPTWLVEYFCGEETLACAINLGMMEDAVAEYYMTEVNRGVPEEAQTVRNSCIVIAPHRWQNLPRSWFYVVGHEFMHCVYGSFHQGVGVEADDPRP